MDKPKKVKIYITPTCSYCQVLKEFLKENNIEYEEYDVAVDAEKREEMIQKTGQLSVPVIEINNEFVVGFNKATLSQLLGI